MKYKGIELEGLDKKVKLSHSRVMETDEGTDWIDKLLTCDNAALTPTQFHEVSALSSVINMDYQICNGGIEQYVFNGYHEYRAPYSDDDVAQLDLNQQFIMLCRLVAFGGDVFPGMDKNEAVLRWAGNFHHCTVIGNRFSMAMKMGMLTSISWGSWRSASRLTTTVLANMWLFSARHTPSTSASHTESPSWSMKGAPTGCPLFLGMGESFPRVHEKGCVLYM